MLSTLSILQGVNSRGVTPIKPLRQVGKKKYDTAFYERCAHLMKWLLIWQVPCDRIKDAFLANGIVFAGGNYLMQLHGNMRRDGRYSTSEKFYKSKRIKELAKLGATFEELYAIYFGAEISERNAQRRYHLKMLLAGRR